MKKVPELIVKHRVLILVVSLLLMIPSLLGMLATRVNYDMLTYLPKEMDTMTGQDELLKEFGKGAFSMVIFEGMPEEEVAEACDEIAAIPHVENALWYSSLGDLSIPMEILPTEVYKAFNSDNATMMIVFYDTSTSADETLEAVSKIKQVAGGKAFVSGMSALVTDLKDLVEREEMIYVGLAAGLALVAMMIFLDNWLIPLLFLGSVGMMILLNMGTNIIFGEVSFITMALAAVLQLAVTMDYSIFLWHSYNEMKEKEPSSEKAMAKAIHKTFGAVAGSSVTTVAGFVALCFMSYKLGIDLGLVMAKGVILGVIGCVTVLPAMILVFDKVLSKTQHRALLPKMGGLAKRIVKIFPVFLVAFAAITVPAYVNYSATNEEVYYDLGASLPEDMDVVVANKKLSEEFKMASTHMILLPTTVSEGEARTMLERMEEVDGVKFVLGLESIIGERVPIEFLPSSITTVLRSDKWELAMVGSKYDTGSDEVNAQIDELNRILKETSSEGLLIGEAPAMKDMIQMMDGDFRAVNTVSIVLVFIIIAIVEKSAILPVLLIALIEVAIFINLGISHLQGESLVFIAPICLSTIQLGATVDYAILMTTRYKSERMGGKDKRRAVEIALSTSIPSIIVSGMGLFAATIGVAIYSDIGMISQICLLLARGAVISMAMVILVLPAMLMLFDKVICLTTIGMKKCLTKERK
ncbi:MMPL family transporter [Candidatus Saccharibacteria bacterium]|nr:MMPL family transporter [Candidatus Saccharibacteria bacterium]MBQ9017229.1 MMPL family transporter [Candidatus Saccharibacteria bacterium]